MNHHPNCRRCRCCCCRNATTTTPSSSLSTFYNNKIGVCTIPIQKQQRNQKKLAKKQQQQQQQQHNRAAIQNNHIDEKDAELIAKIQNKIAQLNTAAKEQEDPCRPQTDQFRRILEAQVLELENKKKRQLSSPPSQVFPVVVAKKNSSAESGCCDERCSVCGEKYVSVTGLLYKICTRCGKRQSGLDSDAIVPFFKESDSSFHYKRINRLNEFLNLMQGKENLTNTEEVHAYVDMIMYHLHTAKNITCVEDITLETTREAMKSLCENRKHLKRYNENYVRFHYMITNTRPPQFTFEQEERIRMRFRFIQSFFEKHKPKWRKNFYSYAYFVYQTCVIEAWYEFLPYLRLHKGTDKRANLDKIWKNICTDADDKDPAMRWPFFKTPYNANDNGAKN